MYQGDLSTSVSLRASWNFPKRFSGQGTSHPGCGRQRDPSKQNINGHECSQISGEAVKLSTRQAGFTNPPAHGSGR